ncbi:MAG: hypothetical protein AAF098_15900 [Pseudomonadota bacterium]
MSVAVAARSWSYESPAINDMEVFIPKALKRNKGLATSWVVEQFPLLRISTGTDDDMGSVRVSASRHKTGFMLHNPKKQIYKERITQNRLPPWMEDQKGLAGLIVV